MLNITQNVFSEVVSVKVEAGNISWPISHISCCDGTILPLKSTEDIL